MSLAEVQQRAAELSSNDRRKLAAFLAALRMKEAGEWDRPTAGEAQRRWISLEEAKRRLLSDA